MRRRRFLKNAAATVAGVSFLPMLGRSAAFALSDPFVKMDATEQASRVRAGEIDPVELLEAAIRRIEALNPALNAVIHKIYDKARELARSGSLPEGAFHGVPYLIKDLAELEGEPLTMGSRLFGFGNIAEFDVGSVMRAKEAGLVILGKTNTPEFGLTSTTESVLLGAARNPWNPEYHTGGSSGGAAAAVASGMTPIAHASDGGGSIRIPASICGLVGLKPSRGRLHVAEGEEFLGDIVVRLGVSRSVRDTARLLDIGERKGFRAHLPPVGMVERPSRARLKIALHTKTYVGTEPHPDVKAAIEKTAQLCARLGHEVTEARPRYNGEEFLEHFMAIWTTTPLELADNAWIIGLAQGRLLSAEGALEPWTLGLAEWHRKREEAKPGIVKRALDYLDKFTRLYDDYFQRFDAELTPVLRLPPRKLGEQAPTLDFETVYDRVLDYVSYTPQHNAAGTPAISLPLFMSPDGLPIGSQFAARRGREKTLLELAYELEQARPWAERWPDISAVNL